MTRRNAIIGWALVGAIIALATVGAVVFSTVIGNRIMDAMCEPRAVTPNAWFTPDGLPFGYALTEDSTVWNRRDCLETRR